jgi:hypothetical protein
VAAWWGSKGQSGRPVGHQPGGLVEPRPGGPAGQKPGKWHCVGGSPLIFGISWCGEAFHRLVFQDAEVSALPCALPQPSMSSASQQGS